MNVPTRARHGPRDLPPLIFVHIPKAAGSTMLYSLKRLYGRENVWVRPGSGWPMNVPESPPSNVRVWAGHMELGLDEYIGVPVTTLTFLRHPVSRLISAYFYLQQHPRNALAHLARNNSLVDFLTTTPAAPEFDNGQVRRLTRGGGDIPLGQCSEAHALSIVESWTQGHLLLGLTEDFDLSLLHFARVLSWPRPYYWVQNTGSGRPAYTLPRAVQAEVEDRHAPEFLLYRSVRNQLVGATSVDGPAVSLTTLRRFQRSNRYIFKTREFPRMARRKIAVEMHRARQRGNFSKHDS